MARLAPHTVLFMLGMRLVEYAAQFGEPAALSIVLAWSRLWWYLPFGLAGGAGLYRWQRAMPLLAAELLVVSLIASPTTLGGAAHVLAPLAAGWTTGSLIRFIASSGDNHGATPPTQQPATR